MHALHILFPTATAVKMQLNILILAWPFYSIAQSLIPNGGFENHNLDKIEWPNQDIYADYSGFNKMSSKWFSPTAYHPVLYCDNVDSSYWYRPKKESADQPHSGNCMLSILLGSKAAKDQFRQYVEIELIRPLKLGKEYSLRLWIKPHAGTNSFCGNLGILFSDTIITKYTNRDKPHSLPYYEPLPQNPQIVFRNVLDKGHWICLSATFVAKSESRFVLIGNFSNQGPTIHAAIGYENVGAWYFLDDISLEEK